MRHLKVIAPDANCNDCIGSCCAYYDEIDIDAEDIPAYAKYLHIPVGGFYNKYINIRRSAKYVNGQLADRGHYTIRHTTDGICSLLNNGCMINAIKPYDCKNYPMNGVYCQSIFVSKSGNITSMPIDYSSKEEHLKRYESSDPRIKRLEALLNRVSPEE